jgi:lipopolysaccharide/colanic/teichoic acid biosynthesis glycosyltransferase
VKILAYLITAVLVPTLVNEFTDWLPWFAARLVVAAARSLPSAARLRYTDEWLAELDATPGKLSKVLVAARIFVRAPATAVIIGRARPSRFTVKRAFDVVVAASLLVLMAPVLAALAVTLKIRHRGSILSRQDMIGSGGEPFTIWKFRTVAVDAEAPTAEILERNPEGAVLGLRRGPQVTRMGAWLRRWSLDELPQVFNILFGDMSLVGPRPAPPAKDRPIPAVKPGIFPSWRYRPRHERRTERGRDV